MNKPAHRIGRPGGTTPGGQPVATYSIVARDPDTGHLGVAVQSHYFSVGSLAPHARAGVGAVTIQSFAKMYYGSEGLRHMAEGESAGRALRSLLAKDHHADYRQVAMVDAQGTVAAHTGNLCIPEAGHHLGDEFACQGNMLLNKDTWCAMAEAFEGTQGELVNRMLAALEAGEGAGGDLRGKRSAAVIVVNSRFTGDPEEDIAFDLRVEDHAQPLTELRRLMVLKKAFQHNNQGGHYLRNSDFESAVQEFSIAESLAPDHQELVFWRAVALVNAGHMDEAEPMFERLFRSSDTWRLMVQRIAHSRFLPENPEVLQRILSLPGESG
ncbi:hypothetical protein B1C78_16480 [Thioalkalivibrio denitrificans]|uniref:Uncharacterized protein n=1 Tax=Thioalkalivibrio denitrificans TaxID=108003 RepID=A0A1V3N7Z9_9GAMM|nr:DUF1028 domain-containing protein [Thioalkalivibrio denitrificans]OOG21217.1 hypothetical protein B1C78_16480 [Thioalkalivibrio denitrificans]